jgi:hypothetical protein
MIRGPAGEPASPGSAELDSCVRSTHSERIGSYSEPTSLCENRESLTHRPDPVVLYAERARLPAASRLAAEGYEEPQFAGAADRGRAVVGAELGVDASPTNTDRTRELFTSRLAE